MSIHSVPGTAKYFAFRIQDLTLLHRLVEISSEKWWGGNSSKSSTQELPFDPTTPLLEYMPQRTESRDSGTSTPMLIAELFYKPQMWKEPKCSSTDEQINKIWYLHAMEYYSARKRAEVLIHATTQTHPENMPNEISQT